MTSAIKVETATLFDNVAPPGSVRQRMAMLSPEGRLTIPAETRATFGRRVVIVLIHTEPIAQIWLLPPSAAEKATRYYRRLVRHHRTNGALGSMEYCQEKLTALLHSVTVPLSKGGRLTIRKSRRTGFDNRVELYYSVTPDVGGDADEYPDLDWLSNVIEVYPYRKKATS